MDISNIDDQHQELLGKGILNSVLSFSEILSWEANEDTDIIKGVISKENLVFISGHPKTGKTSLVLDLGLSLAFNEKWFELNVLQRSKVLFLTGEGGQSKIIDRIKVLGHAIEAVGFSDYFRLSYETNLDLVDDESFAQFIARLANLDIDVLIIDPLVCFHGYDENVPRHMGELVKKLRLMIESLNISIIILHHDTKQGKPLRGHSILEGAYDTLMHLVYNEPKPVKDKNGKSTLRMTNEYWSLDFTCKHAEGPGKWKLSRDGIVFSKKSSESTKDQ